MTSLVLKCDPAVLHFDHSHVLKVFFFDVASPFLSQVVWLPQANRWINRSCITRYSSCTLVGLSNKRPNPSSDHFTTFCPGVFNVLSSPTVTWETRSATPWSHFWWRPTKKGSGTVVFTSSINWADRCWGSTQSPPTSQKYSQSLRRWEPTSSTEIDFKVYCHHSSATHKTHNSQSIVWIGRSYSSSAVETSNYCFTFFGTSTQSFMPLAHYHH